MREIKTVNFNVAGESKAFYIDQLHPIAALTLFNRLLRVLGATLGGFVSGLMSSGQNILALKVDKSLLDSLDVDKALKEFVMSLEDEKQFIDTAGLLLKAVKTQGGQELNLESKEIIALSFKDLLALLFEVLRHNYADFLPASAD